MGSLQAWVAERKLSSIGAFWASAVGASLAYTRKRTPLKPSLRLIHARMHAQALTLAVLSGAAMLHYYDSTYRANVENDEIYKNAPPYDLSSVADEESIIWWIGGLALKAVNFASDIKSDEL